MNGNWDPYYLEYQVRKELLRQNNEIYARISAIEENPVPHDVLVQTISDVIEQGVALDNYYTKTETDAQIAANVPDLTNYYVKSEVDQLFTDLHISDYATHAEITEIVNNINSQIANFYTKMQVDNLLLGFYTKAEVDAKLNDIGLLPEQVNELQARLDAISSTLYDYEGQSQDVIQWIEDHSVIPLRFEAEYNYLYKFNYANITPILEINYQAAFNAALNDISSIQGYITGEPTQILVTFYESGQNVSWMNALKGKTINIRLNPAFNFFDPATGKNRDTRLVIAIRFLGILDGTNPSYNYQQNFSYDDITYGQVQFTLPTEFSDMYILILPTQKGADDQPVPADGTPISDYLPTGKSLADRAAIGLWPAAE